MAKMIELTTERAQQAALAESRPPRVIRVRRLQEYSGRAHYYLDGWPWPVPAWTRHLDGWTVGAVARLAAGLALTVAAAAWWVVGRAR